MPLRSVMRPPGAPGMMGLMPAWGMSEFALKVVCVMPGNPSRGLDAHQGLVGLFDGETGIPEAILDASAITEIRTAAVTAVATGVLARADAEVLAILGAGVQARAHLRALRRLHRSEGIRTDARARGSKAVPERRGGGPRRRRGRPGHELKHAGARARMAEARGACERDRRQHARPRPRSSPETFAAASVFADSRESVETEAGEYRAARERGLEPRDRGRGRATCWPERTPDALGTMKLTVFRSLGIAVEDLAAARLAVETARARGIGTEVAL